MVDRISDAKAPITKPLDRDTGEAAREKKVGDSTPVSSKGSGSSNVKTSVDSIGGDDKQQKKGIVNKLKSMFKF